MDRTGSFVKGRIGSDGQTPEPRESLSRPQVVSYLAGCGLQSCSMLLAKGYPDIGWNPCGGERYLDFLRFAVFVNGEPGVALAWQEA